MESLLEKIRAINSILQRASGERVDFEDVARGLRDKINANVYVVSKKGKILGYAFMEGFACEYMDDIVSNLEHFPQEFNEEMLKHHETKANIAQQSNACVFSYGEEKTKCPFTGKLTTIVPIIGGGERLGTLVLAKFNQEFKDDDLILAEYGATVVGMEILRAQTEEAEEQARKRAAVQVALGTLSYSELEAVEHIFDELNGAEGVLVASKIADRAGITRSVIVNALRKFESAGVIETRSLGMKGTYIRVINENLLDELKKLRRR